MSFEKIQNLIKHVQRYPMLYDTEHDQYKDIKAKDKIWVDIGIMCDINNCKKYWYNLRDRHRDALKRYERKIQKGKKSQKWKHQDAMAFLEKYIKRKNPHDSSILTVYNETISDASLDIFDTTPVMLKEEQSEVTNEHTEEMEEEQFEEEQTEEEEGIEEEGIEEQEEEQEAEQEELLFSSEPKDKTEALIESVREYPVLYNTEHEQYLDSKYKEEIWLKIAAKCDIESISAAKKMWQNLRDCHRDAIKRRNAKIESGQTLSSIRKWKHHDAMDFLEQYISKRESSASEARTFLTDFGAISEDSFEYEPKRRKIATSGTVLNFKMSYEETDRFIKCIQIYPELYNTDYTKYRDVKHKEDIWMEIAKECDMEDANVAKKIWHNLRDSHREAIKRRQARIKKGHAPSNVEKWKHHDAMSFLEQFMTCRDSFKNICSKFPSPGETYISESDSSTAALQHDMLDIPAEILHEKFGKAISDVNFETEHKQTLKRYETPKQNYILDKSKDVLHGGVKGIAQTNEQIEKCSQRTSNPSLYNFFISLYETALKFPPSIQCQVKKKMFNIMMYYEEQLTAGTSTPTASSFRRKNGEAVFEILELE